MGISVTGTWLDLGIILDSAQPIYVISGSIKSGVISPEKTSKDALAVQMPSQAEQISVFRQCGKEGSFLSALGFVKDFTFERASLTDAETLPWGRAP